MELYYFPASPPCRSVMLLTKALGLEPEMKLVDLMARQQYDEDFIKMNPQHTIPLLVDDGFILSESPAILIYLVETYGAESGLYPADVKERAVVHQRLFFDMTTLLARIRDCYLYPVIFKGSRPREDLEPMVTEALSILNSYLEAGDWVAGQTMTVADFALLVTVSTAEAIGVDLSPHERVTGWLQRCKDTMEGYDELNQPGVDTIGQVYHQKLAAVNEA